MNVRESKVKLKSYEDIKVGQIFCDCNGYFDDDDEIHLVSDLFYMRTNYNDSAISLHTGNITSFVPQEKIVAVESFKIAIVEAPNLKQQVNEVSISCGFLFNNNIYIKSALDNDVSVLCIDVSNGISVWIDNDTEVQPLRIEGVYR